MRRIAMKRSVASVPICTGTVTGLTVFLIRDSGFGKEIVRDTGFLLFQIRESGFKEKFVRESGFKVSTGYTFLIIFFF